VTEPPPPPKPPVLPEGTVIRKGSILHYFRPGRVSSSQSSDLCSDPDKLTLLSSSPPGPKAINQEKGATSEPQSKPGLPPTCVRENKVSDTATSRRGACSPDQSEENVVGGLKDDEGSAESENEAISGDEETSSLSTRRLANGGDNLANRQRKTDSTEHMGRRRRRDARPFQKKTTQAVQTTLSLSTKPAFEECKACGMVYNPLHPSDVKLHARRHKSATKVRAHT